MSARPVRAILGPSIAVVVALPIAACSFVATFDGRVPHDGGVTTASDDAGGALDDGASARDGSNTNGSCGGTAGPSMVSVGEYCIDATEVTNAQYQAFLDAAPEPTSQPNGCGAKSSYEPSGSWPVDVAHASFPVVRVDWCDAAAYCVWAGKRLCGKISGGTVDTDDFTNVADSQWFAACSRKGDRKYPYGDAYASMSCNGEDLSTQQALPVGSLTSCEGGYAGIFDMSGNVAEWEDGCKEGSCVQRGGSYLGTSAKVACAAAIMGNATDSHDDVGFRCCSR